MPARARSQPVIHHAVFGPAIAGVLHFALCAAQIRLTQITESQSIIWPANAVLLAMMLQYQPRHWGRVLFAGVAGYVLASLAARGPALAPMLFAPANIIEALIAAWGLTRRGKTRDFLSSPAQVWRFILWAGLIAPLIGGGLGATTAALLFDGSVWGSVLIWYIGDALGLLTLTPFLYAMFHGDYHAEFRRDNWRKRLEALALLLLTGVVSTAVFTADHQMLFLISMPLMLVTFRQGLLGAGVAVIIVAGIGVIATMTQTGPIARMSQVADDQVLYFQLFLAALLVTSFPIAASVAALRLLTRKLQASERSLRLFTAQSPTLLLHFDRDGLCRKALGADGVLDSLPKSLIGASFSALSQDAAAELREAHASVLDDNDTAQSVEFTSPSDPDRWFEATFCALFDEAGCCSGSLASIHNITARRLQTAALARSVETDWLTGTLNRAGFMARLDAALAREPHASSLALAMIDVDRFKLINDNSGHPTGDAVLREVANRIVREVRAVDAVGRIGGDEFIVLIDASNGVDAEEICRRIVAAIAAAPIVLPSGGTLRTAISCGVAQRRPGQTAQQFLEAADVALYEAKRRGRNRVVAA